MFFWTDADIDRMRSFFKEWSTEKDVKRLDSGGHVFRIWSNKNVLMKNMPRRQILLMQLMETVKEIPEEFKKWVSEKAMSFSRYLIYSPKYTKK